MGSFMLRWAIYIFHKTVQKFFKETVLIHLIHVVSFSDVLYSPEKKYT